MNFLTDFLKRAGLQARDMKRNEDRKNSISDVVSNAPEIEFQAKLTMLGAAKNKKKAGRSIEGKVLLPDKC